MSTTQHNLKLSATLDLTKVNLSSQNVNQQLSNSLMTNLIMPSLAGLTIPVGAMVKLHTSLNKISDAFSSVIQPVDELYASLTRIKNNLGFTTTNNVLLDRLSEQSKQNRISIADEAALISRLMYSGLDYKTSEQITGIVSKASFLGGSTVQESKSAQRQFLQSIGSGYLQGDELRTIREQSPGILMALTKGLSLLYNNGDVTDEAYNNPTVGQLKEMGSKGLLTSNIIIKALLEVEKDINSQLEGYKKTSSQALESIQSEITKMYFYGNNGNSIISPLENMIKKADEYFSSENGKNTLQNFADLSTTILTNILNNIEFIAGVANALLSTGQAGRFGASMLVSNAMIGRPIANGISNFANGLASLEMFNLTHGKNAAQNLNMSAQGVFANMVMSAYNEDGRSGQAKLQTILNRFSNASSEEQINAVAPYIPKTQDIHSTIAQIKGLNLKSMALNGTYTVSSSLSQISKYINTTNGDVKLLHSPIQSIAGVLSNPLVSFGMSTVISLVSALVAMRREQRQKELDQSAGMTENIHNTEEIYKTLLSNNPYKNATWMNGEISTKLTPNDSSFFNNSIGNIVPNTVAFGLGYKRNSTDKDFLTWTGSLQNILKNRDIQDLYYNYNPETYSKLFGEGNIASKIIGNGMVSRLMAEEQVGWLKEYISFIEHYQKDIMDFVTNKTDKTTFENQINQYVKKANDTLEGIEQNTSKKDYLHKRIVDMADISQYKSDKSLVNNFAITISGDVSNLDTEKVAKELINKIVTGMKKSAESNAGIYDIGR